MKDLNKREQSNSRFTPTEHKNLRSGLKDFAAIDFERRIMSIAAYALWE